MRKDPLTDAVDKLIMAIRSIEYAGKAIEIVGQKLESASMFNFEPQPPAFSEMEQEDINPYKDSRTFSGQSSEDYCFECLTKHFSKAYALMDEAERFAVSAGKITPAAVEKIRRAISEIVGAEDDIESTVFKDPELKKLIDQIIAGMRQVRKEAWGRRVALGQGTIDDIRELKAKVEQLQQLAYKGGELYITKEQRDKIMKYLEELGITDITAIKASDIIGKAAAGIITLEEASKELEELLGWSEVKLEFDENGKLVLTGKR